MKRIRIIHNTQYHYRQPVTFGTHRAMLRPREGHDVHIVKSRLDIGPPATLRWLRDIMAIPSRSSISRKPRRRSAS